MVAHLKFAFINTLKTYSKPKSILLFTGKILHHEFRILIGSTSQWN